MRNVVLIGGSGYLGSHVLSSLSKRDLKVYVVINKNKVAKSDNIEIIEGGIKALTVDLLKKIKPEAIYHCGRPTYSRLKSIGRRLAAKKAYYLNERLLSIIMKGSPNSKLVFASGSLGYGNSDTLIYEDQKLNPISYSKQYIAGEYPFIRSVTSDLNIMLLRFPWLLGNGSWFSWFYLNNIVSTGQIPLFGEGKNTMSIIDIKDAAELMVRYGESIYEKGVFNIFSDNQVSQSDFAINVSKVFNCDIVPHSIIYPKLEKAAREAFFSNIELGTLNSSILDDYSFTHIIKTLEQIKMG